MLVTWNVKPRPLRYTVVRSTEGSVEHLGEFDTPEMAQEFSEALQAKELKKAMGPR